ncbi:cation:proton antiporter [Myroides sp. LJL119]
MELYYSFSILIVLAAVFSYVNLRFLKLPGTIGIMLIALLISVAIRVLGDNYFPETTRDFFTLFNSLDFNEILMGAMLNFLLFAGAMHVRVRDLKSLAYTIATYATISVVISAFIISGLLFYIAPMVGIEIPYIYCLLFGTLISPTDPIVVMGILKQAKVPKRVETKITGESLFNDGVAVVMFAVVLQIATNPDFNVDFFSVSKLFLLEAGGGIILGLILGFTGSRAIKQVNDYKTSALITLSIVMGGFLVANQFHISSPLAMVIAGLIIGNYGKRVAMDDTTEDYLTKFWELVDDIMNAILFLFIGFELLIIPNIISQIHLGIICVFLVLFARGLSIVIPAVSILRKNTFSKGSLPVMIWGGIRGGVSIALVLSLPNSIYKDILLEITYIVVLFSIVVQGLSVGKLAQWCFKDQKE